MEFDRQLGVVDCVLLSVGGMVGSAIFVFPGTTGTLAGPLAIGAWFFAGVLMFAIALCYTELSLAFPSTGGPAVFPYRTLGPSRTVRTFASYLEGTGYTIGWIFGLTVSALAVADYLAILVPAAAGHTTLVALTALGLAAACNVAGVDVASRTNLLFSALLLTVLVVFVAVGAGHLQPRYYDAPVASGPLGFFAAVQVAITAYGAWTVIPSAAEEIRAPARTIPRAILASLALTTILYTSVVAVLHGVVAPERFTGDGALMTAPLSVAVDTVGLAWLRPLVATAAVFAIFTTLLVGIMGSSRVLYALGENRTLPSAFAATSDRFRTPWIGIVAVSVVAGSLSAVPQYFYQLLVVAAVIGTGVPYAINVLSFVGLRYYRTDVDSRFTAPFGLALPATAFCALGLAMFGLGTTELLWSTAAVIVLCGYFVLRVIRHDTVLGAGLPADEDTGDESTPLN